MTTASLTIRTRMMVQDLGQPFSMSVTTDGVATVYPLTVESVSSSPNSPVVTLDGVPIPQGATPQYTIDYKYGVLNFTTPPAAGQTLQVVGTYYDFFDDNEVLQAVQDAFNLHVNAQSPLPVIDPLPGQTAIPSTEEYLVSIMASVELLWFRATEAAQEVDIHTPEGVNIPRAQRYQQIIEHIKELQDEYKAIASQLNVGIWRIQVLTQRRVSYTTNRYVPEYVPQEYNSPYTGFSPTTGAPGTLVTVQGKYFTNTTQVTFGGVPAIFTVVDDSTLTTIVPVGGLTGQIGIVTPGGVILSTAQFVVGQPAPFINYGPAMVDPPVPPGI